MILKQQFYQASTVQVAQDLLGTFLVHDSAKGRTVGRIVETEAYLSKNDPACHAHRGKTKRNAVMFGPPGCSYVYLIYGMYHCLNVVTAPQGDAEAVLIRALEPLAGLELMKKRRGTDSLHKLCNGPGKLAMACGINSKHNGLCLRTGCLKIHSRESFSHLCQKLGNFDIVRTTRIGISQAEHLPLRFYIKDNQFISYK